MGHTIALAGNPNSGKTTMFNQLAGAREKIGNWPGTTVERKEGRLRLGSDEHTLVDLPGIYTLSACSLDECVARDFLVKEKPALVVAIIDASNLERNLYLPLQLLEEGQNVVLALNMMDLVEKQGMKINMKELSRILGIPVVPTVASRGKGVTELKEIIAANLSSRPAVLHLDYGAVEETLHGLEDILRKEGAGAGMPLRTAAVRIMEQDPGAIKHFENSPLWPTISNIVRHAQSQLDEDPEPYMAERRYAFLKGLVSECTSRHMTFEQRLTVSDRIDRVVTDRLLGIPIFLLFMFLLFSLVFLLGNPVAGRMDAFFHSLSGIACSLTARAGLPPWLCSLVSEGIIPGVGSVLMFLPYILLLFFGISCLEDSGYLARGAFIMDRLMHALGLHGKSFIPMLLGFGCSIPGIMAARTLDSEKDRILTILILPLISCSARLPVFTLFAGALFPGRQGLVVFSLYLLGIVIAVIAARVLKAALFREESAPLIMELPPYRMPNWRNALIHMWLRAVMFLKKAGTIIIAAVIVIWALASLPAGVDYASGQSVIGRIGSAVAPVLAPAGFGDWKAAVALMTGVVAKENVVSTLGTLYGVEDAGLGQVISRHFTPLSAYAFLVMTLVYIPCIATVVTIRNELNWKWAAFSVVYTLALGWTLSVLVYQAGKLIF
jgi:ferrous iron transport protein B